MQVLWKLCRDKSDIGNNMASWINLWHEHMLVLHSWHLAHWFIQTVAVFPVVEPINDVMLIYAGQVNVQWSLSCTTTPRDDQIVVSQDRWFLIGGINSMKSISKVSWKVVFEARWSLIGVVSQDRDHCIHILKDEKCFWYSNLIWKAVLYFAVLMSGV